MSTIVNIILGLAGAGFLLVAFLHDEWLHRDRAERTGQGSKKDKGHFHGKVGVNNLSI